jgi:hypothetical protein
LTWPAGHAFKNGVSDISPTFVPIHSGEFFARPQVQGEFL